jgi:hypothetical protein
LRDEGFDITNDGESFIMVKSDEASIPCKLTALQDWSAEIKTTGNQSSTV